MFSTFTKENVGTLIIRTENLQRIEDVGDAACKVAWLENGVINQARVTGTAQENYSRLQSEELRLIEAAAQRQRRHEAQPPLSPIPRGRAGR